MAVTILSLYTYLSPHVKWWCELIWDWNVLLQQISYVIHWWCFLNNSERHFLRSHLKVLLKYKATFWIIQSLKNVCNLKTKTKKALPLSYSNEESSSFPFIPLFLFFFLLSFVFLLLFFFFSLFLFNKYIRKTCIIIKQSK